jgi:hypothetical protein
MKKVSFFLLIFSSLLFFRIAFAAETGIVPCGHSAPCTLCHLIIGIYNIVQFGLKLLVTAPLAAITIAGVMYVLAGGTDMINSAKSFLRSAITGFALVLGAWLIVSVTMWLISAKEDLGIGKTGWRSGSITYACSTKSSTSEGSNPTPTKESKCCVKNPDKTSPTYGKAENCSEPKEVETADKKTEKKCAEGSGTLTDGTCSSLPACGGKQSSGSCEATNNGCGGLPAPNVGDGCDHTSPELAAKLSCLKGKGVNASISSVTKNGLPDWCEKCVNSYAGSGVCSHANGSCHFGGKNCKGISSAVDLNPTQAVADAAVACGFDTVIFNNKAYYGGQVKSSSSIGHTDHVHASVNNKACGCDYLQNK